MMLDSDGYPKDEVLNLIKDYDIVKNGIEGFIEIVNEVWSSYGSSHKGYKYWYLSTGGWSGNESIIKSMKNNSLFWMIHWYESKRGGLYVFQIRS